MSSRIPKACLEDIQRIQRNFIWGDGENDQKFHAVRWSMVTTPKQLGGLGLRKLDEMNQACLLKLCWKLTSGHNEFWCEVLKGKYKVLDTANISNAKSTDSSIWKALINLKSHLDINTFWTIGDGSYIDAWNQSWIEPGYTVTQNCVVPFHLQGARVCNLIEENGQWNWNILVDWLPNDVQNKIAAIPPPCAANGHDERAGFGGKSSDFSVSVMYDMLCHFNRQDFDPVWSKVWKLCVTERVRCFIWLLLHNRLLTNHLKSKMGLGHAMCRYCGNVAETSLYAMRDCPLIIPFWLQVVPIEERGTFFMEEHHKWIIMNLNKCRKQQNGSAWCDFWATTCHNLWMWRNKEMHDEDFVRPMYAIQYVSDKVENYMEAKKATKVLGCREVVSTQIGWIPPTADFVKLNTDGARKQHNIAGCGGIIRGSQGEWLGGFAKGVGNCSAFVAELWGVYEGLSYARRLGFMKVELNIDSTIVVNVLTKGFIQKKNVLTKGSLQSPAGTMLVRNIRSLMAFDWEVTIVHVYRESNRCVDALANIGCTLDKEIIVYDDFPSEIRELLLADVLGISNPRLISV